MDFGHLIEMITNDAKREQLIEALAQPTIVVIVRVWRGRNSAHSMEYIVVTPLCTQHGSSDVMDGTDWEATLGEVFHAEALQKTPRLITVVPVQNKAALKHQTEILGTQHMLTEKFDADGNLTLEGPMAEEFAGGPDDWH